MTVADIGTGSGILAIAAIRLGASRILALEIDEGAVECARRNVQVNDLTDRVVVAHREIDNDRDGVFDLVLANLFPSILIDKAPVLGKAVRHGGVLIMSGVVCKRINEVGAIVESVGFQILEELSMGGWAARAMRRQT
jgi:ribosomal protein L11 methyltransferase